MRVLTFRVRGLTERRLDEQRASRPARPLARLAVSAVAVAAVVYSGEIHRAVEVMQRAQVDLPTATQALHLARRTNANGAFVLREGVDKANAIGLAGRVDAPGAVLVSGIDFTRVGGITAAGVSPKVRGVSVQYTVSGTDGYYDSRTLQTDEAGTVWFRIPRARPAVRDTISVSAVLSGVTASTTFVW